MDENPPEIIEAEAVPPNVESNVPRVLHAYDLILQDGAQVLFTIAIDPPSPPSNYHTFSLFSKSAFVQRQVSHSVPLLLSFLPSSADFQVILIPRQGESFPANSLYSLRVWLVKDGHQHRLFSDDYFWIAKNPEFNLNWKGSTMAAVVHAKLRRHVMEASVGGAFLQFIINVDPVDPPIGTNAHAYHISLLYEREGVTRQLSPPLPIHISTALSSINFMIYTAFLRKTPTESVHRLFLWIRSEDIYQRLWKLDAFRISFGIDVHGFKDAVVAKRIGGDDMDKEDIPIEGDIPTEEGTDDKGDGGSGSRDARVLSVSPPPELEQASPSLPVVKGKIVKLDVTEAKKWQDEDEAVLEGKNRRSNKLAILEFARFGSRSGSGSDSRAEVRKGKQREDVVTRSKTS